MGQKRRNNNADGNNMRSNINISEYEEARQSHDQSIDNDFLDSPDVSDEELSQELSQEHLQSVIEALQDQNDELQDKLVRTIAEMENLRKRTSKEITDSAKYAITQFARDLLGIYDNLSRALEAVQGDMDGKALPDETKNLIDGVIMTKRELVNSLERNNTVKIEIIEGETLLDPNLHQAMFVDDDISVPNNTICKVLQEGFMINDRVLRPAMVGVAKGGAKAEAKTQASAASPEANGDENKNKASKAAIDKIFKKNDKPQKPHKIDKKA